MLKQSFLGMVLLSSCAFLTGCGGSSGDDTHPDEGAPGAHASRIYLLTAASGSLSAAPSVNTADVRRTLTLENLQPEAMWYEDRPGRDVGATALPDYADTIWRSAYGDTAPNATVQFRLNGDHELEGIYAVLSRPAYDAKANSMTFEAELLNDTIGPVATGALAFNNVTVNVLNNAEDDQKISSYVQYATEAVVRPTATSGAYEVVLSDAGPDMFWVDNAPGRYADSAPMSDFFPQWSYLFADHPPNAALFGTTAGGDAKLYFLTLTEPEYLRASGQVRYTATLLGQNHGALETLRQAVLSIDSTPERPGFPGGKLGKGSAYQAFGQGYNPSTANNSYIYFGSDIARRQTGSLWGTESHLRQPCAEHCRNDLQTLKDMGINLIRLYDWDPRNDHSQFLDYAHSLGLKVVVPISNWLPEQNEATWDQQVPAYFEYGNFGNRAETDWHPAVAGVIISNELDMDDKSAHLYGQAIGLTARFIREADALGYSKDVRVGLPVSFTPGRPSGAPLGPNNTVMSSWNQFHQLLNDPRITSIENFRDRLMLCPNTYNDAHELFVNYQGRTGNGWTQLTYAQFQVPILYTEIGRSLLLDQDPPAYVKGQLQAALQHQRTHPEQLLGVIHFQFDNKVWMQDTTEGAFGTFRHDAPVHWIQTVREDFDFGLDAGETGALAIDTLTPTALHPAVVEAYTRSYE